MLKRITISGCLAWSAVIGAAEGPIIHAPADLNHIPPSQSAASRTPDASSTGRVRAIVRFAPESLESEIDALSATAGGSSYARPARTARRLGLRRLEARLVREAGPGLRVTRRFSGVPFLAVEADATDLARLQASDLVAAVTKDMLVRPALAGSVPLIGARQAHLAGYDGTGQLIAVLDTGVMTTHAYFAGRVRTDLEACFSNAPESGDVGLCPAGPGLNPCVDSQGQSVAGSVCGPGAAAVDKCIGASGCDHGTHVSGIALGNPGVAPGAELIPVQVFFRRGSSLYAQSSDLMAALDYVLGLKEGGEPVAAINMSIGGDGYTSTALCDSDAAGEKAIVDQLRAAGVATVVAAGNNGWPGALTFPGCISSVISVGATDKSDRIWSGSNRHSTLTAFAPGVLITSAAISNPTGAKTGTSMATPHVAGTVALLAQAGHGEPYSVANLVAALQHAGIPVADKYGVQRLRSDVAIDTLRAPVGMPYRLIVDSHVGGLGEYPPVDSSSVNAVSGSFQSLQTSDAFAGDVWRGASDTEPNTAVFAPILIPGLYSVDLWWPALEGNGNAVQVAVGNDLGENLMVVDQTVEGRRWVPLGTYPFMTTATPYVALSDQGQGQVAIDAVRFTAVNTVAPVKILDTDLPAAAAHAQTRIQLQATGGLQPYRWSLHAGPLPSGLALDADTGEIAGSTADPGDWQIAIRVQDSLGLSQTREFSLRVLAALDDLILDNDESGTSADGSWTLNVNPYYKHYRGSARATNSLTASYRFSPEIVSGGRWRVHAWWSAWPDRSSRVAYRVAHADGATSVDIDQRVGGGQWTSLGVFTLPPGHGSMVELRNQSGGYAMADAVRLEWIDNGSGPPPEISTVQLPIAVIGTAYRYQLEAAGGVAPYVWQAVGQLPVGLTLERGGVLAGIPGVSGATFVHAQLSDASGSTTARTLALNVLAAPPGDAIVDNDTSGTSQVGTWGLNTNIYYKNYQGSARASNNPANRYRFTPTLPHAGRWRVHVWWSRWRDRSSRVEYTVAHREGSAKIEVDQRQGGNQWTSLGVFAFDSGSDGYVQLQSLASGYAMADAIRVEWVDGTLPGP